MLLEKAETLTSADIEVAIANFFKPRTHLIVPNISWGMGLHECDVLIMNERNFGIEVEIKVSKADLKKDLKKPHQHLSNRIRRLYFAIPEYLDKPDVIDLIPARAGVLVVVPAKPVWEMKSWLNPPERYISYYTKPRCEIRRNAKINKSAKPFSDAERINMGRLGMLRYWEIRNKY